MACGFLLITLAFGKKFIRQKISNRLSHLLDSFGAGFFLLLAAAGLAGGAFFYNILPPGAPFAFASGGLIPLYNIAVGIKISAGVFSVFLALTILRIRREKGKKQGELYTSDDLTE